MKPQTLTLRNYRAFEAAEIDLAAVEAAAIVGPNGAGKSTLTEAMLFALFGETRSTDVDGPVRIGAQEASVQYDYAMNGASYRIIRKRSKGKKSSLDYLIGNGGDWTHLTGASIAETQAKIERDLGMSKSLFLASSCVMQGQSAGICEAGPADRKKVLMEILADRLAKFGPLAESAKLEVKRIDEELAATRAERGRLEAVIADRNETECYKGVMEGDLAEARQSIVGLEQESANLEKRLAEEEAKQARLEQIAADVRTLEAEVGKLLMESSDLARKIGESEALLESADDVRAKCEELARTEASLAQFRAAKDRYQELGAKYRELNAQLTAEGERLGAEETRLHDRIEAAKGRLIGAAQRHSLINEVPCANSPLDYIPMAEECKLLANARAAGDEIAQIEAEITGYETQSADISSRIKAHTLRYGAELDPIKAEAQAIGYDAEAHKMLEARAGELAPSRELLPRIEGAAVAKAAAEESLAKVNDRLADRQAALETTRAAATAAADQAGSTRWADLKRTTDAALAEARDKADRANREIGVCDERLRQIDAAAQRLSEIADYTGALDHSRTIYATLQQAFGRDGIPALVIDHAVPQIQEMANDILQRLSGGRMSVRFVTQRATKTAGVAETLDIIVSDQQGERPYEDWSGGERLRVDLAVRIALGRMLAARTGAKIETLVLDEVCAPLDESGEEALIDCIARLQESFGCILLITHRESLRDRLPQQISVYANGAGSAVELSV